MDDRKLCGSCSSWRPLAEFHRDRARPDGLHNFCKDCRARLGRIYRASQDKGYVLFDAKGQPWRQPPLPLR